MTRIYGFATALMLLLSGTSASAFLDVVEGAAEVDVLTLKTSAQQTVYASVCDDCRTLTLSINAQTAFYNGGQRVALSSVAQVPRGATVFFDPRTYKVTRVQFWK